MNTYTVTHCTEQCTLQETVLAYSGCAVLIWALERFGVGAISVRCTEIGTVATFS